MQGASKVFIGLALLAGAVGIIMTLKPIGLIAWGALAMAVFGGILLIGGIYEAMRPKQELLDAQKAYKSSSTTRILMQSMLATALADGQLNDDEIEAIAEACGEVMHQHLEPGSIRRLAAQVEEKGGAILDEIRYEGKMLNPEARKAVIDACVMVLMADGKANTRETAAVNAIGEQLGLSNEETEAIIKETISAG